MNGIIVPYPFTLLSSLILSFFSILILSLLYLCTTARMQDLILEQPPTTELYSRQIVFSDAERRGPCAH